MNETFPEIMYCFKETDGKWYLTSETLEDCADKVNWTLVGVYHLEKIVSVKLEVTEKLIIND